MDDRQATDTDTRLSAYLNEHLLASEGGLCLRSTLQAAHGLAHSMRPR